MSYGIVLHGKKDEIRKHTEAMTAIAPTVAYKVRYTAGVTSTFPMMNDCVLSYYFTDDECVFNILENNRPESWYGSYSKGMIYTLDFNEDEYIDSDEVSLYFAIVLFMLINDMSIKLKSGCSLQYLLNIPEVRDILITKLNSMLTKTYTQDMMVIAKAYVEFVLQHKINFVNIHLFLMRFKAYSIEDRNTIIDSILSGDSI